MELKWMTGDDEWVLGEDMVVGEWAAAEAMIRDDL
jgi:hypothetical protein